MAVKAYLFVAYFFGWSITGLSIIANLDNFKGWVLFVLSVAFLMLRGYSYYLTLKKNELTLRTTYGRKRIKPSKEEQQYPVSSRITA